MKNKNLNHHLSNKLVALLGASKVSIGIIILILCIMLIVFHIIPEDSIPLAIIK